MNYNLYKLKVHGQKYVFSENTWTNIYLLEIYLNFKMICFNNLLIFYKNDWLNIDVFSKKKNVEAVRNGPNILIGDHVANVAKLLNIDDKHECSLFFFIMSQQLKGHYPTKNLENSRVDGF